MPARHRGPWAARKCGDRRAGVSARQVSGGRGEWNVDLDAIACLDKARHSLPASYLAAVGRHFGRDTVSPLGHVNVVQVGVYDSHPAVPTVYAGLAVSE